MHRERASWEKTAPLLNLIPKQSLTRCSWLASVVCQLEMLLRCQDHCVAHELFAHLRLHDGDGLDAPRENSNDKESDGFGSRNQEERASGFESQAGTAERLGCFSGALDKICITSGQRAHKMRGSPSSTARRDIFVDEGSADNTQ